MKMILFFLALTIALTAIIHLEKANKLNDIIDTTQTVRKKNKLINIYLNSIYFFF
jgi:hypothetical protein